MIVGIVLVVVVAAFCLAYVSLAWPVRPEAPEEATIAVADTRPFRVGMPISIDGERMVVTAIGQHHLRVRR